MNAAIESAYTLLRNTGHDKITSLKMIAVAWSLTVRDVMLILGMDVEG